MALSEKAEEAAGFFAKMLDHEYTSKDVFCDNFFHDWRKVGGCVWGVGLVHSCKLYLEVLVGRERGRERRERRREGRDVGKEGGRGEGRDGGER
jgi:hypothetical protein